MTYKITAIELRNASNLQQLLNTDEKQMKTIQFVKKVINLLIHSTSHRKKIGIKDKARDEAKNLKNIIKRLEQKYRKS